jgi:hypothetical protein
LLLHKEGQLYGILHKSTNSWRSMQNDKLKALSEQISIWKKARQHLLKEICQYIRIEEGIAK